MKGRLLSETESLSNYVYLDSEPLARIGYNLSDRTGDVVHWPVAYYHNNPVGAPLAATDGAGQVVWGGNLDAFGRFGEVNPAISQNLRFPGQYLDAETGWHYNMQRYYDPSMGRYLQSDPIGLGGGG